MFSCFLRVSAKAVEPRCHDHPNALIGSQQDNLASRDIHIDLRSGECVIVALECVISARIARVL